MHDLRKKNTSWFVLCQNSDESGYLERREKEKEAARDGHTNTSAIILTCGTTSVLGSVVWSFENKSVLTQENQVKGGSCYHFTKPRMF